MIWAFRLDPHMLKRRIEVDRKIVSCLVLVVAVVLFSFLSVSRARAEEYDDAGDLRLQAMLVFGTPLNSASRKVRGVYTESLFLQRYACRIGDGYYPCYVYVLAGDTLGFCIIIFDGQKVFQVDVVEAGDVKPVWRRRN